MANLLPDVSILVERKLRGRLEVRWKWLLDLVQRNWPLKGCYIEIDGYGWWTDDSLDLYFAVAQYKKKMEKSRPNP